ncbi:hypothetical protein LAZ67_13000975 [Cordylochernes scorpioides]|uniref:RNA-directed DNA polymerase n=1 Tax=Cordylochernes scorpioides TaxID=51811 RepID=A0ABY6L5X2_9ARAC|nr:hypothetical protein LAZ67_13000975 [Cordylochernes scorpioides]
MSYSQFKNLNLQTEPSSSIYINQANSRTRSFGRFKVNLTISHITHQIDLHILRNFMYPLLRGLDMETLFNLHVDIKNGVVTTKGPSLYNYKFQANHLRPETNQTLDKILNKYTTIFSENYFYVGKIKIAKHNIHTVPHPPIQLRPYRRSASEYEEIKRQVEDLKKKGLVRDNRSPWAFPVTLVPKADGQMRLCVDYRRLNALIIYDKMPLPNIQEIIDHLQGAKYFTSLYTDASEQGLGAILAQKHPEGRERVVSNSSKRLNPTQSRYTATELECFAIIEAVRHFNNYLDKSFQIITDHSALKWLLNHKNPGGRLFRWSMVLSSRSFTIIHRAGGEQTRVDALSRNPVCTFITEDKMKIAQQQVDLRFVNNPQIKSGIVTIRIRGHSKAVVPDSLRAKCLHHFYDDFGHPGKNKTLKLISTYDWWLQMLRTIKEHYQIPDSDLQPFDLIGLDTIVLGNEAKKTRHKYLQVIIDHHSRYIWACPTRQVEDLKKKGLVRDSRNPWAFPVTLVPKADGQKRLQLPSSTSLDSCYLLEYQSNTCGMEEKANHTLLTRLRAAILEKPKQKWSTLVPFIVKTYDQTPHEVTKFSPTFLLYGIDESPSFSDHSITLEEARGLARENTRKAQIKRKNLHDDKHPDVEFSEGDQVLRTVAKHHPCMSKLSPRQQGPFFVKKKISSLVYDIQDTEGRVYRAHASQLRSFKDRESWEPGGVTIMKVRLTANLRKDVSLEESCRDTNVLLRRIKRYRNARAIETPLQSETRRALRRLRYSEARVAATQTMQVPVQRIQLWTHKPFSGLQYNAHIDYKADSSVDIGQMSRWSQNKNPAMSFRLASLNVRGIAARQRSLELCSFLKQHAVDIAFVHETNVSTLDAVEDLCLGYTAAVAPASAIRGSGLGCLVAPGISILGKRIMFPGKVAVFDVDVRGQQTKFINCHLSHLPDERLQQLQSIRTAAVNENMGKKSADTELKTMIVHMSSEIRNLGEKIDTRLSNIEKRIIEWDQRLLGVEMKLTTCVETSAATNEKVSENVTKLREIEARTDFLEMKLREPNLVFYGVEGEANEGPAESLQKVKSIIKEKMLILENISITKCHRLGKANKSPILISLPEYEDRIKLFKNTTKLRDSKIYISKDYSKKIRDQRLILIAKRKELFEKGTRSKLRDNKLFVKGVVYEAVNGQVVNTNGNKI